MQTQRCRTLHILASILLLATRLAAEDRLAPLETGGQPVGRILLNGGVMNGTLVSAGSATGVVWSCPGIAGDITFNLAKVREIELGGTAVEIGPDEVLSRIRLSNDDELMGRLVELGGDTLVLETRFAGTLRIQRAMLAAIYPNFRKAPHFYEGPVGLADWKLSGSAGEPAVSYKGGSFYIAGFGATLGKNLDLPERFMLEFDFERKGGRLLEVCFFTDTLKGSDGNCYALRFEQNAVGLERRGKGARSQRMEKVSVPALQKATTIHVALMADIQRRAFFLEVNGVFVKRWTDSRPFESKGRGLLFSVASGGWTRISAIRASPWDGKYKDRSEEPPPKQEDRIRFLNDDRVSGRLDKIRRGTVRFTTEYGAFDVPLNRIVAIGMAEKGRGVARRRALDLRAYFHGRGRVTVALDRIENGFVYGQSENFGECTLRLDAFRNLRFNVHSQP